MANLLEVTMLIYTFKNNLDNRAVSIQSTSMRHAMTFAAVKLGVKKVNLLFISLTDRKVK